MFGGLGKKLGLDAVFKPLMNVACMAASVMAPGLAPVVIQAYQAVEAAKKAVKALKNGGLPALMQQAMQAGLNQAMQNLVPQDALKDVVAQADETLTNRASEAFQKVVEEARKAGLPWHDALAKGLPELGSPEVAELLQQAIRDELA